MQGLGLADVRTLSQQGLSDGALSAAIEQRGLDFILTPQDAESLKADGVSEPIVRYLQGRADGEQEAYRRMVRGGRYYGRPYPYYSYYPVYTGVSYYRHGHGHHHHHRRDD